MSDSQPPKMAWPCLNYEDAPGAIRFLVDVLGFEERLVVAGAEEGVVEHAELHWPEGGGVMPASAGRNESEFSSLPTGTASVYLVTDDPDTLYTRVVDAGVRVVAEIRDEDYGSRGFGIADPEGNLWSFGTYRGAP